MFVSFSIILGFHFHVNWHHDLHTSPIQANSCYLNFFLFYPQFEKIVKKCKKNISFKKCISLEILVGLPHMINCDQCMQWITSSDQNIINKYAKIYNLHMQLIIISVYHCLKVCLHIFPIETGECVFFKHSYEKRVKERKCIC